MLTGLIVLGGLGALCGFGLALASKVFYVYVDPKIEAVAEALPGANCGGCGFAGCGANAEAIVKGRSSASSCVAGGPDVAAAVAAVLGISVEAREPDFARPGCTYGVQDADLKFLYEGVQDCRAAVLLGGGSKVCPIGCVGLGTCARACPFDALSMGPDNLPVVNLAKCTGCGTCERICPKNIITLTSNSRRVGREYTLDQCTAPCQRSCPAGIEIPVYIRKIREGDPLGAVEVIKETNPFPLVCGRICVHPCEAECRRNLVDEPVAINHLKRYAADYEMKSGKRVQIPRAPESGKPVAVIGGGAEGLTAAYFVNRLGHDAVVYEGSPRLGGLLRTGLAENRLPQDVLDWEINGILDAGVQAKTHQKLGKNFTVDSLLNEGFQAVFVATGGWDTQMSEREREQALPGVQVLLDFILKQRAGKKPGLGKNVMILGGGKAALEAARECVKEGAKSVRIVMRKSREAAVYSEPELAAAEQEGIRFHFQSALTKMMGEGPALTQAEVVRLATDGTEEQRETIPVDTLLTGAGRFPELIYVRRKAETEEGTQKQGVIRWETLTPYPSPFAGQDIGIFRPGEVTSDYKAVVEAIGAGRRAANSVHKFLTGKTVEAPVRMIRKTTEVLTVKAIEPVTISRRVEMPEISEERRVADPQAEIATGYSPEQALEESKRCLQCGLICYRRMEGKQVPIH
jgi:NADPH-dependent glutamate synthase beta subunit-like oxidoreductase